MLITALVGCPVWVLVLGAPASPVTIFGAVPLGVVGLVVGAALLEKLGGIAVGRQHHERLRPRQLSALTAIDWGSRDVVLR